MYFLGVKEQFKNRNYKISLHPVIEYSLELPYGRQARIWITTETACYRIMSVSANYISYWQPFYEMVCFAGHVVNILLNYSGPIMMVKLVKKVSKLSGLSLDATYELFKNHRKFIQDLLKDQNLPTKTFKEYNALQSNSANWEISWEDHLKAEEMKVDNKGKVNILSFFRSKSNENSSNSLNSSDSTVSDQSSKKASTTFDDTSSLLSISEDESVIYIESPYETLDEIEAEKPAEAAIQSYIGSSFTSSGFLEWKLPENDSLNESFYNCPLCKITFKTDEKDCISAFSVHLRAHRADCKAISGSPAESFSDFDFETRISNFRADLRKLITGTVSYNPLCLKFEKKINGFSPEISERPFTQYAVLSEETTTDPITVNPIRVLKFSANIGTTSASKSSPSTTAAPAPKKPRVKKPLTPKTPSIVADSDSEISSTGPSDGQITPVISGPSSISSNDNGLAKNNSADTFDLDLVNNNSANFANLPTITGVNDVIQALTVLNDEPLWAPFPSSSIITNPPSIPVSGSTSPLSLVSITSPVDSDTLPPLYSVPASLQTDLKSIVSMGANRKRSFSTADDSMVAPPVPGPSDKVASYSPDKKNYGCSHYKANCKIYAECCGKWFTCRFCHDTASTHKIIRQEIRFCLCMFCGTSQKASGKCSNPKCNSVFACYFCDKCKFWYNDPNRLIYHCDKCGICRTGLKTNYTHCDRCEKCVSNQSFLNHPCVSPIEREIFDALDIANQFNNNNNFPSLDASNGNIQKHELSLEREFVSSHPQMTENNMKLIDLSLEATKPVVDQTTYINYLKNSLGYCANKGPNDASTTTEKAVPRRNCWNCMSSLPTGLDGTFNGKYCPYCSAIID